MADLLAELRSVLGDRYRVDRELGHGGMALVFLAEDLKHGRTVALKVLRTEIAESLGPERFLREIGIAARLSHPHIVPLFDSGQAGRFLYYVMPYIEGESLRQRLVREPRLPIDQAIHLAGNVASALGHAHRHGVIHRDIKPENILLAGGDALVADFGIARSVDPDTVSSLTTAGIAIGTIAYMSPEQATGGTVDARTDLYALGCVLYESVAGTPPFGGTTPQEQLAGRLAGAPPDIRNTRPDAPHRLASLLGRLLATNPDERVATADELQVALVAAGLAAAPAARSWVRWAIGAALVAAIIVIAIFLIRRPAGAPADPAARPLTSLAVLPFANLSADPANEYFGDGLSEELINILSRIEGLKVSPRTSAFGFRGKNVGLDSIAAALDVGAVVEGSVRRAGPTLRVTARLVRLSDGRPLWNGEFDQRSADDVFAIQDSISRSIVREILPRLNVTGGLTPRFFQTSNGAAHDLYLKGRFFWNLRTAAGISQAIDLFRQAITIDPGYPAAHAGLADAIAVAAFYDYRLPATAFPEARRAAEEALALDPTAGEPHATLGYVSMYHDWDYPTAEFEFQTVTRLRPDYSVGHQWYANLLTILRRFDEAEDQWQRARELEPLSLIQIAAPGWMAYYQRDYRRMAGLERDVLARDSNFVIAQYWLGLALEQLGEFPEAIAALRRAHAASGGGILALTGLGHAFAVAGMPDSALGVAAELERRAAGGEHLPSFEVATVYAGLRDADRAMGWLERAHQERSHSIAFLGADPRLDGIRSLPRFARLTLRVKQGQPDSTRRRPSRRPPG